MSLEHKAQLKASPPPLLGAREAHSTQNTSLHTESPHRRGWDSLCNSYGGLIRNLPRAVCQICSKHRSLKRTHQKLGPGQGPHAESTANKGFYVLSWCNASQAEDKANVGLSFETTQRLASSRQRAIAEIEIYDGFGPTWTLDQRILLNPKKFHMCFTQETPLVTSTSDSAPDHTLCDGSAPDWYTLFLPAIKRKPNNKAALTLPSTEASLADSKALLREMNDTSRKPNPHKKSATSVARFSICPPAYFLCC